MKDWYELTNGLETDIPPLDQVTEGRIRKRVGAALTRRRKRLPLAAAIAAAVLLTACGYAVATGQFSHWFWNISQDLQAPEASEELFAGMGTVIGQSQTAEGVTMTLDAALWDGEYMVLSLTVEGLDIPENHWISVESGESWLGSSRAAYEKKLLEQYGALAREGEREEDFRQMAEQLWEDSLVWKRPDMDCVWNRQGGFYRLQVQRQVAGGPGGPAEMTLHLENLKIREKILEGPFEFTFSLEPKPVEVVYTGDVVVEGEDFPAIRVSRVRITPFRAEMEFTTLEPTEEDLFRCLKIRMLRAGEEEVGGSGASGMRVEQQDDGSRTYRAMDGPFRRVLDPAAVTAIGLNGTWLELSGLELQP